MKKFTIFFLMMFMYLGNQARCEAAPSTANVDGAKSSYSALCETHPSYSLNTVKTDVDATKTVVVTVEGPSAACGGTIHLTAVVTDNDLADTIGYTYVWFRDGNPILISEVPSAHSRVLEMNVDLLTEGQTEFYVEATKNYPVCVTTASPRFIFTKASLEATASAQNGCVGSPLTLSAMVNAPYTSSNLNYTWYKVGTPDVVVGTTPTVEIANPVNGDQYKVRVYDYETFCVDTSAPITLVVNTPTAVSLTLTPNRTISCTDQMITLKAAGAPATATNVVYKWYRNSVLFATTEADSVMDAPSAIGTTATYTYYVEFTANDDNGCAISANATAAAVTVYPEMELTVTGPALNCTGTAFTLTATLQGASTGNETFQWYLDGAAEGAAQTVAIASPFTTTTLAQTKTSQAIPYIYTVLATDPSGCTTLSDPFYVYVNENPVVSISTTSAEVCEGGQVTLTANASGDLNYQWYHTTVDDANKITNGTGVSVDVNPTTTINKYIVVVTDRDGHCTGQGEITITVNSKPTVAIIDPTADQTICEGGQVTLTATAITGATYKWYDNNQVIAGADQGTLTVSPEVYGNSTTIHNYSVVASLDEPGCSSAMSAVRKVTTQPKPVVVFSGAQDICKGTDVNITATVNGALAGLDVATINWYRNNAAATGTATATTTTASYTEPSAALSVETPYNYVVSISGIGTGCDVTSDPYTVTVHSEPVVMVSANVNTICADGQVTLTAESTSEVTYVWYKDAIATGNEIGTTPSVQVAPTATTTYYAQATTVNGSCTGSANLTITVNTKPTVAIVSPTADQTICEGDQVTIKATAIAGATYTWYDNNIEIAGASHDSLTLSPLAEANSVTVHTYTVMAALAAPGCESDMSAARKVTVQPRPEVVVTGPALHCSGAEFTLTATLRSVSTGTENFKWYLDGASTPVANQDVTIATPFTTTTLTQTKNFRVNPYMYTVLATEPNGCSVMSDPFYVYVDTTPTVTIATTSAAVCEGGEVTLTANASGDLNYQWYHTSVAEANKIGDGTGASITVAPTSTINKYIVVVTDRNNYCVGQGDTTITITTKPTVAITPAANQTICEGDQVILAATVVAGATYTWYDNNIEIDGATLSTLILSPETVANSVTAHRYT
ncbi:MAG: hypothetical protein IJT04_01225, partial [Bacteroidales bacterium]|nr:hypothetical protein [Bacteroidales bacterium]